MLILYRCHIELCRLHGAIVRGERILAHGPTDQNQVRLVVCALRQQLRYLAEAIDAVERTIGRAPAQTPPPANPGASTPSALTPRRP